MDAIIAICLVLVFVWQLYQKYIKGAEGYEEVRDERGRTFRVEDYDRPEWNKVPRSRIRHKLPKPPPSDDFRLESTGVPTTCPTCKTAGRIESNSGGGWRCAVCGESWSD